MRRIERKEALEIKAEANGLVSWIEARDPKLGRGVRVRAAVTVDIVNKKYAYDPKRCVGCA